ncbi:MAG: hypothetical protein J2P37_32910, partial [Ktedonobacteraceae bacterium]|nr:hypothetical protein [Ktedonobacteraceae bacterium]
MGYTHSWRWIGRIIDTEKFIKWSVDVERLYAHYSENPPPNPHIQEPWFRLCKELMGKWDTTICGPHGDYYPIFR